MDPSNRGRDRLDGEDLERVGRVGVIDADGVAMIDVHAQVGVPDEHQHQPQQEQAGAYECGHREPRRAAGEQEVEHGVPLRLVRRGNGGIPARDRS